MPANHTIEQLDQQIQFIESLYRLPDYLAWENEILYMENLCYPICLRKIHQIEQRDALVSTATLRA